MQTLVSVARAIARLSFLGLSCSLLSLSLSPFILDAKEAEAPAPSQLPTASLYELSSVWKDQKGAAFSWKDIKNQPVLLSMVYTRCERSCPLIISELLGIMKGLSKAEQDKIQVLVISFDPLRDTVDQLRHYAETRKIDAKWRFLHGSEDDVAELAAVLNFRYKKLESGDFAHSNTVTVLDQNGRIYHQQMEVLKGREQTLEKLKKILK